MIAQTTTAAPAMTVQERDRAFDRAICDCLELFHVCPKDACRRSGACRGEPRPCLDRCAAFLSRELQEWIDAVQDAKDDGLSVDDALEQSEPHVDALVTWVFGLQCGRYAWHVPRRRP